MSELVSFRSVGLKFSLTRGGSFFRKREPFWPLRDVSFTINKGDVLGIIGRNGSGKSTCARLIAGIYKPTEGTICRTVDASLLALGLGFNAQLTCRQNIRINCAHLNIFGEQAIAVESAVLDYAELEKFADQPVKVLSSGMRSRLMFSIALQQKPELLVLDEVLATGDRFFRDKAMSSLRELVDQSKGVVIISHQERILAELCTELIWLDQGRIAQSGAPDQVLSAYRG